MPADLRLVMNLAQIRRLEGLSQADLAQRIGRSQSAVSRMERAPNVALSDAASFLAACGVEHLRLVCDVRGRPVEVVFPAQSDVSTA